MGDILNATEVSIKAATHLSGVDAGAVETIRALALRIDLMDEYFKELVDQATERNLRPPSPDNVSIPTYLKYCESLGLTPAGRVKIAPAKSGGESGGGKLGKFRSIQGGQSA